MWRARTILLIMDGQAENTFWYFCMHHSPYFFSFSLSYQSMNDFAKAKENYIKVRNQDECSFDKQKPSSAVCNIVEYLHMWHHFAKFIIRWWDGKRCFKSLFIKKKIKLPALLKVKMGTSDFWQSPILTSLIYYWSQTAWNNAK